MALPQNFSQTEHLQDTIKRTFGRIVREHFSDLGGEDWDPNITTSRASARVACTHQESDTINQTIARMMLFQYFVGNGVPDNLVAGGGPVHGDQAIVRYRPQLVLLFQEQITTVREGESPVNGRISVRIAENSDRLTESSLKQLGTKVKASFGGPRGFLWKKGKKLFTYNDKIKGYNFIVYCPNQTVGRNIVTKTLRLIGESPDWTLANFKQTVDESGAYPNSPRRKVILGKSRKLPKKRPIANVYFRTAFVNIYGLPNPIYLYDNSGAYPQALIREFGN